jgi:hypothetical protein
MIVVSQGTRARIDTWAGSGMATRADQQGSLGADRVNHSRCRGIRHHDVATIGGRHQRTQAGFRGQRQHEPEQPGALAGEIAQHAPHRPAVEIEPRIAIMQSREQAAEVVAVAVEDRLYLQPAAGSSKHVITVRCRPASF